MVFHIVFSLITASQLHNDDLSIFLALRSDKAYQAVRRGSCKSYEQSGITSNKIVGGEIGPQFSLQEWGERMTKKLVGKLGHSFLYKNGGRE
ncbi:hypothetical protein BGL48_02765 [Salinivibrio sp. SS3]|nr:hypothetical protein BGL48_02765 [Salinivibrio sp. BNH]